jgi:two-component system, cell cycle sensor histidine kinase and response regulator CckA
VRGLVARFLERLGYAVLEASDGIEALEITDRLEGEIDLLLTDVVMPRMNGRELADEMRLRHPETKILFTSGYPADTMIRRGIADGAVAFIQKPYLAEELLRKLRATLA